MPRYMALMIQSASRIERFLVLSVLFTLVWLPLPLGSNRDWAMGLFVVWIGLLAGVWGLSRLFVANGSTRHNRALTEATPLLCLLVLAQCWVAIQLLFKLSVDSGSTFQYLLLGVGYCLLFVLILSLFTTRRRLNMLLITLVMSGAAQGFWGTLMALSASDWLLVSRKVGSIGDATGTFVNRNHLAGYLEMTLACGIGLLIALRDRRPLSLIGLLELLMGPKARLRLAIVIMVTALVMTHSRMGNISFLVSLLIVGGLFLLVDKNHRVRNGLILASLLIVDVLVVSQYFGLERLKDRLIDTRFHDVVADHEVTQRANVIRDDIFVDAMPLLNEKPLVGLGAGSFEAVFPKYSGRDVQLHFDHAHNDYLQFAIEYGALGTVPLAIFVLLALWHGMMALIQTHSTYRSGVGFAAAMGIIALLIHSIADFNLQIPANAATLVVICAIAVLARTHTNTLRSGKS